MLTAQFIMPASVQTGLTSNLFTIASQAGGGLITKSQTMADIFPTKLLQFCRKFGPTKRVDHLLDRDLIAGGYVVTANKRVRPVLHPQLAKKINEAGKEEEGLFFTASNAVKKPTPEWIPAAVAGNILVCAQANEIPESGGLFLTGRPFYKGNEHLGKFCGKKAGDSDPFVIVRVPRIFPIPFNVDIASGKVDENVYAAFAAVYPDFGTDWLKFVLRFYPDFMNAAILAADDLKRIVPAISCLDRYCTDLFVRCTPVASNEYEDEFGDHVARLDSALLAIGHKNQAVIVSPPPVKDLFLDAQPNSVRGTSVLDDNAADDANGTLASSLPTATHNHAKARHHLLFGMWGKNGFEPPQLTKRGVAFEALKSRADRKDFVRDALRTHTARRVKSRDFVAQLICFPVLDGVMRGNFAQGYFQTSPATSFQSVSDAEGFSILFALPILPAAAKERTKQDSIRRKQEILGEATEHLQMLSTNVSSVASVTDRAQIVPFIANAHALITVFDQKPRVDEDTFSLYGALDSLAVAVTSYRTAAFFNDHPREYPHLTCWVINAADKIFTTLAENCEDYSFVQAVATGDYTAVGGDRFRQARRSLELLLERLEGVVSGSEGLSEPILWKTSPEKKAMDRAKEERIAAAAAKNAVTPIKRKRDDSDPKANQRTAGDIVFTAEPWERMPMPTYAGGKQPCAAFYQHGIACKYNRCKFAHDPWAKISIENRMRWVKLVKSDSRLEFNYQRVKAKDVSDLQFTQGEGIDLQQGNVPRRGAEGATAETEANEATEDGKVDNP